MVGTFFIFIFHSFLIRGFQNGIILQLTTVQSVIQTELLNGKIVSYNEFFFFRCWIVFSDIFFFCVLKYYTFLFVIKYLIKYENSLIISIVGILSSVNFENLNRLYTKPRTTVFR